MRKKLKALLTDISRLIKIILNFDDYARFRLKCKIILRLSYIHKPEFVHEMNRPLVRDRDKKQNAYV